jgi:hypothetical protein
MQTILHQGRPTPAHIWAVLPEDFAPTYQSLGYETRELVLREEAEQAKTEHFNAALEQAAAVVRAELGVVAGATVVAMLMDKKLPVKISA